MQNESRLSKDCTTLITDQKSIFLKIIKKEALVIILVGNMKKVRMEFGSVIIGS